MEAFDYPINTTTDGLLFVLGVVPVHPDWMPLI